MPARILAFPFEGLPRVPAISVARSRAIARGLATGAELSLSARGLGRIQLSVDGVEPMGMRTGNTSHPSPESAFMLLRADGTAACLTVERFFALSLVRTALSAPAPPVLRPLSPSERGVLAAIVAGVIAGADAGGVRVSLERLRPVDERERVTIHFTARTAGIVGVVALDIPISWFPSAAARLSADAAVMLETTLSVRVARTELTGAAYLSAEVGDVVVFDGVSSPADADPWPCQLWIGAKCLDAELLPDGDLRPSGTLREGQAAGNTSDQMSDRMSDKDKYGRVGDGGLDPEGASLLASSPVEVVAEIGRVPMRGDEVLGLVNGVVLSLGERRRDLVTLRVGGRVWARGELVNVDDELGVRITEIVRQR